MPAKDRYHDMVKRALIKDGWTVVNEQVYLSDNERHIWIDLGARRDGEASVILVDVKGLEGNPSLLDAVMSSLGQYAVYQAMLDYLNLPNPLFLAVPKAAYDGLFQAPVLQQAIHNLTIRLLVFDPIMEEIVLWIP